MSRIGFLNLGNWTHGLWEASPQEAVNDLQRIRKKCAGVCTITRAGRQITAVRINDQSGKPLALYQPHRFLNGKLETGGHQVLMTSDVYAKLYPKG